jgi:hypothetical protein
MIGNLPKKHSETKISANRQKLEFVIKHRKVCIIKNTFTYEKPTINIKNTGGSSSA